MPRKFKRKPKTKKILREVILEQLEDLKKKIKKGTPIQKGIAQDYPLLTIIEKNIWQCLIFWGED